MDGHTVLVISYINQHLTSTSASKIQYHTPLLTTNCMVYGCLSATISPINQFTNRHPISYISTAWQFPHYPYIQKVLKQCSAHLPLVLICPLCWADVIPAELPSTGAEQQAQIMSDSVSCMPSNEPDNGDHCMCSPPMWRLVAMTGTLVGW